MPDTDPVISIEDLHKSYGALDVLNGVSLSAKRGEVVSLIGSSGSGKSTLLRCANLLESPQQGEILFKGEPVRWTGTGTARRPADAAQVLRIRTNLSMVFQQFNLWSHMTILQNVMEAPVSVLGHPKEDTKRAALAYLEKVGIAEKADAYGLLGWARFRRITWPTMLRLGWPAYTNEAIFLFHATTLVYFSAFPTWQQRGDALYYARYFADKTFNPFVPYPILAGYFIILTLIVIWIFGFMNRRLNSHLPQDQRTGLKLRFNFIR